MKIAFLLILMLFGQARKPMVSPPQVGVTSSTGPHQAVLNWSNPSCTTNAQCSLQVYRAQCTSITSCPVYSPGSGSFTTLVMTTNLVPTVGASGTSWVYTDSTQNAAMQDSTTYVWVATNTYVNGSQPSGASTAYSGTTNNGTPSAPTLSANGNSVN